ncbi:MAG: tol-pal system-associated acyl-CoA thioesterase [Methylophilales bacterium]|nr:tol-pal system-associated acyl-CoA thioesterase [Methylophilales bacterium]
MSSFSWPIRIYYESTDAGGVVYHAEYLKFFERGRSEWLRHLGFEHTQLKAEFGIIFVVRDLHIKYLQPARFDELLHVVTSLLEVGRSRLVFEQKLQRGDEVLTAAEVEVVSVDCETFKPTTISPTMKQHFLEIK